MSGFGLSSKPSTHGDRDFRISVSLPSNIWKGLYAELYGGVV